MSRRAKGTKRKKSHAGSTKGKSKRVSPAAEIEKAEPRRGTPAVAWCIALFATALTLRLIYLAELNASPLAGLLLGDALSYHSWAQRLAAGDWLGSDVFYQAPAYPYFLGALYALAGESLLVARVSQAVLGSLACVLLALAGARWFSPRGGLVAGLLLALFAPAIFFVGLIQKTTLALFLLCVLLFVVSRTGGGGQLNPRLALASGMLLGALALTRENALILVFPLALWLVFEPATSPRRRLHSVGALVLGLLVVLAPVIGRNYLLSRELHVTTSQLGPNLYIGNNPDATGYYRPLVEGRQDARFERTDAQALAEEALSRPLTPAEVSSFYVSRVVDYVRSEPLDWLRLVGKKFLLVWNATEVGDTEDLYAFASHFRVLAITLPLHFGVLLPLAVIGVAVTWRERRQRGLYLLYAIALVYAASVVAFYLFSRYRFPIVPVVCLFAGVAITEGLAWLRCQPAKRLGLVTACALAGLVVSNLPLIDRERMQATTHYNLGFGLARQALREEALDQFERALRIEPGFAMARSERAVVLEELGRTEEAVRELERAVRDDPTDAIALANLGELELELSRIDSAERHFTQALEHDPESTLAHGGLARIYFARRELPKARHHFEQSLTLNPDNAAAHNNLGVIAAMEGELDRAVSHFEAAVALEPDYDEARRNLERARNQLGR